SIRQYGLLLDRGFPDHRAVRAVEVFDNRGFLDAVYSNPSVTARHIRIVEPDVARRIAADNVVSFRQHKTAIVRDKPAPRLIGLRVRRSSTECISDAMYRSNA